MTDLEGEQQADCLDTLSTPINVVPQEEVAGLRGHSSVLKEAQHVVVLSMDISADLEGGGDFKEHGLFKEDGFDDTNES